MNDEGDMMSGSIKETQEEFPWIEVEQEFVRVRGEANSLGKSLG